MIITAITPDVEKKYIERILAEIDLTPQKSMDLFEKRLRKKYPDATKEELESLKKKESYLRLETREECLAKLKTTLYIGEATNDYILKLLTTENLLDKQDLVNSRYVSGGDPTTASIAATEKIQKLEKEEASR